jgi:hypothetical protein
MNRGLAPAINILSYLLLIIANGAHIIPTYPKMFPCRPLAYKLPMQPNSTFPS